MSENDQPPVPPQSSGSGAPDSEPDESTPVEPTAAEPTEAEPTPAEPEADDVVIAPPVPGETEAAPAAPARNKNVIIAAAVTAGIIVIGGIFWAVVALGDDDGDDAKAESKTTSIEDFCDVIKAMDASEDTRDDPTIVSDALRDAGTPEEMGDDEKAGRDLLIEIGDDAEDGPAAEKAVTDLDEEKTAQVQAFITYIGTVCAEPTPSEPAS